ncbi:MarR family winged helix-turn-helix transcriptional regulator [Gordonia sp. NPDC003424]
MSTSEASDATQDMAVALLRFVDLLAFASHSNAKRRRFETATGLLVPRSGIETLDILARRPHTAKQLSAVLRIDLTQSSRQVARLVRAGLVAKGRSDADGRLVVLELTDHGRSVVRRWQTSWLIEMRRPLDGWRDTTIATFTRWMSLVLERLGPTIADDPAVPLLSSTDSPDLTAPLTGRTVVDDCLRVIGDLVYLFGREDFDAFLRDSGVDIDRQRFFVVQDVGLFGPTTISELAARLDIEQSRASRTVTALTDDGMLRKQIGGDGRERRLVLSEQGAAALDDVREKRLGLLRSAFDDLPDAMRAKYATLTERYLDELMATSDNAARRYISTIPPAIE